MQLKLGLSINNILGRPFIKRFNGSPYAIRPLSVLSVCNVKRIKMPLGTEVGLGPGHIVLDGDRVLPRKGAQQSLPTLRPMSVVLKLSPISTTAELLFAMQQKL